MATLSSVAPAGTVILKKASDPEAPLRPVTGTPLVIGVAWVLLAGGMVTDTVAALLVSLSSRSLLSGSTTICSV